MTITNQNRPNEICKVNFERRGWFSKEQFKLTGEVYYMDGKNKQVTHLIEGNWNDKVSIVDPKSGQRTVVWTKAPYPANVDSMYGMSHFSL